MGCNEILMTRSREWHLFKLVSVVIKHLNESSFENLFRFMCPNCKDHLVSWKVGGILNECYSKEYIKDIYKCELKELHKYFSYKAFDWVRELCFVSAFLF